MYTLPTISILDKDLLVDLRRMEFREVANPGNRISFYDLKDKGEFLLLLYDPSSQKAHDANIANQEANATVQEVRLPPLDQLDPFTYTLLAHRQDTRLAMLNRAKQVLHHRPKGRTHKG